MAVIEMNWRPSNRDLRVFAVVQLIVAGVVGWLLHRRLGWDAAAIAVAGSSCAATVVGFVSPQILRPLFVAWMLAAFPLGWLMSHLLLACVYYGVVTPIGFALRLSGRDSLQLRSKPDIGTYWVTRPESPDSSRYFRQF
jgi:Saxitoxin biosynthesis operon protein SxtJ